MMDLDKAKKLILFIGFIIATFLAVDARYAPAGFVNQIDERLDRKINEDKLDDLDSRIFKLDDRYGPGCERCDPEVLETYRFLKAEHKKLFLKLYPKEVAE